MNQVILRELDRSDLPVLNEWRANKDLVAQLGGNFHYVNSEVDDKWFDQYLSSRSVNIRLAICRHDTDAFIGVVYLLNIDWLNRNAEFAIQIGEPSEQNRGVGSEATRLMLDHAFADLNLHRIYLTVLTTNQRAIAMYEKLGFQKEGIFRQAAWKEGAFRDIYTMAILSPMLGDKP